MAVPSLLHFSRADAHVKSGCVILPLIVIAMFARMIAGVNREGRGGEPFRSCRGPRESWSRASLKHASSPRTAAVGLLLFIYPRFRFPLRRPPPCRVACTNRPNRQMSRKGKQRLDEPVNATTVIVIRILIQRRW